MLLRMHHTGFVVSDLDVAVRFYEDVVGLTLIGRRERDGGPISQILGYENTHIKIAEFFYGDGEQGTGHQIELIEYVHPPGSDAHIKERNSFGASHIAFEVEDIFEAYERLIANGAQKLNPPIEIVEGKKGCYLQDPDGNWVELLELA